MATETGAVTGSAALERQKRRIDPIELLGKFAPVLFLIVLVVVFSSLQPAFATERNFWFLLRQYFVYGILAGLRRIPGASLHFQLFYKPLGRHRIYGREFPGRRDHCFQQRDHQHSSNRVIAGRILL